MQNQIWENNSDVITCLFMFVCPCHICHVYMLSLACWNFTYQELSGGWVGSSLTFCHAVFISHPTRSMHSFPPWEGIFEITKHNAVNFSFVNECNSMMLQCSNNHTMLNQRSFPFLRKTEKCVPGLSFQLHIQFEHVARKFANKLFDGFTCFTTFMCLLHVALCDAGVDQGLFGAPGSPMP